MRMGLFQHLKKPGTMKKLLLHAVWYSAWALAIFLFYYFVYAPDVEKQRQERDAAERQKSEATTRKAAEEKEQKQLKIAEMEKKFDAVYFPPKQIDGRSFTYEVQEFFKKHAGDTVVFRGYLKDIEASKENALVEFVCIGERFLLSAANVRFRFAVSKSDVGEFMKAKDYLERDYFIAARIMDVKIVRTYECHGNGDGENLEVDAEVSRGIAVTGQLIKAVPIEEGNRSGPWACLA